MVPFSTPPFLIVYNAPRPLKLPSLHRSSSSMTKSSLSKTLPMLSGYNRKEKSLEELSRKFLQMFLHAEETCISLDRITAFLGVERRRIYDIINILESLGLVTRRGKNNYRWNGFQRVYDTVRSFEGLDLEAIKGLTCMSNFPVKREKSLKLLSIGFLGLFLRWKTTMSLEEAAKSLSENIKTEDHKIKTKIRRLYDIANVFKSLGLIRKTVLSNKKPAFHWVGVHGLDEFVESHNKEEKKEEKKETQKSELDREFLMKCLMTLLEKPTASQETPSQQSHNFVTPTIKRTLTIIYPKTEETQTPGSLEHSQLKREVSRDFEGFALKECGNELKRKPLGNICQGLDISLKSSFKKIKRVEYDVIDNKENIRPMANC